MKVINKKRSMKCTKMKLKDWKNPQDYTSLKDLTKTQWAWEFLRRNPKYIEEWEELTKDLTEEQRKDAPRSLISAGIDYSWTKWNGKKWGLDCHIINPEYDIDPVKDLFLPMGGELAQIQLTREGSSQGMRFFFNPNYTTGSIHMKFYLNQPISPQIKNAQMKLKEYQKEFKLKGNETRKSFKPHQDDWIKLIRILDAIEAGADYREIAYVLFPNMGGDPVKWIYDKKKRAMRYVEQDYRLIPFSEE